MNKKSRDLRLENYGAKSRDYILSSLTFKKNISYLLCHPGLDRFHLDFSSGFLP